MITPKQQENFNVELRALQLKYGVDLYPAVILQIREIQPEQKVIPLIDNVEEAKIIEK
jgi:hypothetical protein